jgi:L-threonylcarbamoyladenylate synthase
MASNAGAARIKQAARTIKGGGLVAFPTETVYGLGANALDGDAVRKIFKAKGRPADNPIIVHITDERMLRGVVRRVPKEARALMRRFWPGPLTVLFEKSDAVPDAVTAGLPTVAVRMPSHPVARALIKAAGVPIAAPSANRSGRPSPTTAAHVLQDFPRTMVLDGGPCAHGLESTVVSVDGTPRVLRLGAITLERIRRAVPGIALAGRASGIPVSPGMKYKHYAPSKPLLLFTSLAKLRSYAKAHPHAVVMCKDQYAKRFPNAILLGKTDEDVARNLFAALRTKRGTELLALGVRKSGHGRAIMDRLERAASKII